MSYLQIVASMPSGLPPAHFDCYLALADWGRMPIRSLGHEEQQCIDRSQPLATITSADMDCEPESPLHDNASTNHHVRRPCTTITMADIHPVPVSPLHAADCCTANVIWRWCACSVCSADKSIDGKNSNPVLLTAVAVATDWSAVTSAQTGFHFSASGLCHWSNWKHQKQTISISNNLSPPMLPLLLCAVDGNVWQMTYPVCLMSEERFRLNQLGQYFEPAA